MNDEFNIPDQEVPRLNRLTRAQLQAAKARVTDCAGGFTYWTPTKTAPVYPTRGAAEEGSIQEWRENL